ncbi:MAG: short-chain dehydrogenase [Deltaproteobacteria bacterium HGW-Deltaproteobacteria-13]|jgi:3-dehydrosphinganine reductase|nr:MAG: short-chain dehydrogenase [Deltaproteobacteria bacterium HGW-Deltaproteobacteria-13]
MFEGKNVVITGGSSGLGLAMGKELSARGAIVTLIARNREKLEMARTAIKNAGRPVHVFSSDVSRIESITETFKNIEDAVGSPDILINSAGILREGYFDELSVETFREVIETNYFGVLNSIKAALPSIIKQKGRIVNISSVAGLMGVFGYTTYCSSKFALVGLTESLRYEMNPLGVSVHLVCPSEFASPMTEHLNDTRTPENKAHTLTIPEYDIDTMVRDTIKGIKKGKFLIVPGKFCRLTVWGARHFPAITRFVSDLRISREFVDRL